jgi:hypothetical protein
MSNTNTIITNITEQELSSLMSCTNPREWNAATDVIIGERGGRYPPDWMKRVLQSGLMARVQKTWHPWPGSEVGGN